MANFDYWDLKDDLDLRYTKSEEETFAEVRTRVIETLEEHIDFEPGEPGEAALEGPTYTLVFWLADANQVCTAYAIPNEALDDTMRADLERIPGSFGRRGDFVPDQQGRDIAAAVRWMAALETEGLAPDGFIERIARPWLEGVAPEIRPSEEELRARHRSLFEYDVWSMDPDKVFVELDGGLDHPFERIWTVQRGT